jgi:serine phosphatase RsbU (regulator of sigma subunit)
LIKPTPSPASLDELTRPALLAIALAVSIGAIDGIAGGGYILIGFLAFPPFLVAARASVVETVLVAGLCLALTLLSALWNGNIGSSDYAIRVLVVLVGGAAATWVAVLRHSLSRERAAAELLAEAGLLLEQNLGSGERAEQVARIAVPDLADLATVDLCGPNAAILRGATASRYPELEREFKQYRSRHPIRVRGDHPAALAIRTGEVQFIETTSEAALERIASDDRELELLQRARPASVLAVPLKARGSVLGALSLWVIDPGRGHDQRARHVALGLAHRAGLAVDNARLHERQSHIAGVLQKALRPRSLPEITGLRVSARFQAAGEAHLVGGDFYDAFETDSDSWTVVIGDVCGKGPEAASLTALARYTIRAASTPESTPSDVLRALHRSVVNDGSEVRFLTAALARITAAPNGRDSARLTIALGGHPPPLALRRDGRVEPLGRPGTLLGALADPAVFDVEASLAPGESIVLYTDGMLDSRDRRGADDPGWLAGRLRGANGAGADELAEQLTRLAIERQGGEPRDDIAVLVLQRSGHG